MKCESTQQWLVAYLTGKLPVWRRMAVSLHIRRCTSCALEANELSEMTSLLSESLADARELKLEPHRVRALFAAALGNVVPFSLNRTHRPSSVKGQIAVAAGVMLTIALGSLFGFNYGKSQVQDNMVAEEILELDRSPRMAMNDENTGSDSKVYGLEPAESEFAALGRLPEYGMGFALQPQKATYSYPYHGVPGPRSPYTTYNRSEQND